MEAKKQASLLVLTFMAEVANMSVAKRCALIAVNVMIDEIVSNGSNVDFGNRFDYWNEVKLEIDKS